MNEALIELMGKENSQLNLAATPPATILMAGLQGAGKTTTVGKLSKFIKDQDKKKENPARIGRRVPPCRD